MISSGSLCASEIAGDAVEPAVHRLAVLLRVAVIGRADEEPDVVLGAEQRVEPLQPRVGLLEPRASKKSFSLARMMTGFGAIAARKSA